MPPALFAAPAAEPTQSIQPTRTKYCQQDCPEDQLGIEVLHSQPGLAGITFSKATEAMTSLATELGKMQREKANGTTDLITHGPKVPAAQAMPAEAIHGATTPVEKTDSPHEHS